MPDDVELSDQVREVMAHAFGTDDDDLPEDVSLETYGLWTSLSHMALLVSLEEHFDTRFSMEAMPRMTSLPRIIAVLKQHGVE